MGIKISELTKTNSVASTDLLVLETSEGTKSVEVNKVGGLPQIDYGTFNSVNSKRITVSGGCRYVMRIYSSVIRRMSAWMIYQSTTTVQYKALTDSVNDEIVLRSKDGYLYITSNTSANSYLYIEPINDVTKDRLIVETFNKDDEPIPSGTTVWKGLSSGSNERVLTKAEYDALPDTKLTDGITYYISDVDGGISEFSGALYHNSIGRGKYLGSSVTSEQYSAIANGSFDGLYIGDYWTIGGVNYRIAGFDYYLHCGDTDLTTHHVVIVPDTALYDTQMNTSATTNGGYVGSAMYTSGLTQAKTTINSAFSGHVLSHRVYLVDAVSSGKPSNGGWYDSTVELMNEQMVYGCGIFSAVSDGNNVPINYRIEKSQLPLFKFRGDLISNRTTYWLRDVVATSRFANVYQSGNAFANNADNSNGVRPYFCIKG